MRILLVEDDKILQQMYMDAFAKEKIQTMVASEGKEGLIQAAKQRPDFIIMDIMMPGMDGVTAYRHLKEIPEIKETPIAFLTVVPEGVPEAISHQEDLFKDVVGYWRKDKHSPIEIVKMVKEYLEKHSQNI